MIPDYKTFSNQFVLCKLEKHIPAVWRKRELGKWLLGFHPSLPVVEIQSSNSANLGWLLGYPIDENSTILEEVALYDGKLENLFEFESWLYRLVGTFAAVLITPHSSRFYLDAGGSLPAVFHPEREIVASAPTLIGSAEDDESLIKTMGVPEQNNWFPFGLTPKKSVERLIPNHYLDLVTWHSCRHWPKDGTITVQQDTESIVQEIVEIITRNIEGVAREYPVYMSLTAGQDTRTLLACARNLLDRITFFTWQVPDETGRLDCVIASEIAQRFSLKHEIIRYQQATEQQQKDWLDRTGHCIGGRIHRSFAMLYQLDPKYPLISGIAGAIGRAHYYNKLDATHNTELTGERITRLLRLPQTPEIVNRANKWLQGLSDYDPLTILDLLFIEQLSGCWAGLSMYGNNWNIFEIYPFLNRRIFELILSLPYEYRIKRKLNLDLIKSQWPELLKFPINNYRGIRGLRRSFRALRKDIRRLEVVRSLRKVLKNMKE